MGPIALTAQMRELLDRQIKDGNPALVASSSIVGQPDIAYKGSVAVLDDEHLSYWERAHGQTLSNLVENPEVCVLYRNPQQRVIWKFFGRAELFRTGAKRMEILARSNQLELDRDPERKGVAVLIRVDRVVQLGQVIMQRATMG
ncbi:MAG: pyridoxamine 5'-phosphate oxidase family protein [Dehalococcoidia bacterium]